MTDRCDTAHGDPMHEALVRIAERQTLGLSALADVADSRFVRHLEAPMLDVATLLAFAHEVMVLARERPGGSGQTVRKDAIRDAANRHLTRERP